MAINKFNYEQYIKVRGYYGMVPNELWESEQLDTFEKVIWAYIASQKPDWKSSRNNLARNLKVTRKKISKAVLELESYNMLKVSRSPSGSWDFEVVPPNAWLLKVSTPGISSNPVLGTLGVHTKDSIINNKNRRKLFFPKEGRIFCDPLGALGDQQVVKKCAPS